MPSVLMFALLALVAAAALYDFRFRRIPNWLNLSGLVLGLGINTLLFAAHGLLAASLGTLLPLALYVPLYLLRAMGAGDVKLMAAVGAIAGPRNWIEILVCTAFAGGVLALAVAARNGRLQRTFFNLMLLASELTHWRRPAARHETLDVRSDRSMRMPHAIAIAAGSLAFLIVNRFF
ncbi:MAG: prepilin peptidase [Acidobacteriaceae bacterium]|nr:prepilin peptidase [Acidobacteriaceae bacterium]